VNESKSPGWKRAVEVGLGVLGIILSRLVFVHPGITIASIMYIAGIILIIVGIEKIISGIFVANKSRWGAIGLGVLAIIFGSIAVAAPVSTAVFVIFMLGFGLLFLGISHVVYGIGSSQSLRWDLREGRSWNTIFTATRRLRCILYIITKEDTKKLFWSIDNSFFSFSSQSVILCRFPLCLGPL